MSRNEIEKVTANGLCTGCGLCASIAGPKAVRMTVSPAGYARPRVMTEIAPEKMDVIRDTCPGMVLDGAKSSARVAPSKYWGPVESCTTGYSTDDRVRYQGSSGGVVSALVIHLLESGAVKAVVQTTAGTEDPIGSQLQVSRTRDEVIASAGSRYCPSSPLATITSLLDRGEPIAFVGKPCDVAALRAYGRHDARVGQLVKAMISFMCAGVPSREGAKAVVGALGMKVEDVVTFRYRGEGWPGYAKAVAKDGTVGSMDYSKSWGTILNRHLQFRCKICPDGTGEFADVTCADAWFGKDGYPEFEERDGRSLILARTELGSRLVQEALAAGAIVNEPLPLERVGGMQPYQMKRKQVLIARLVGLRLRMKPAPRYRRMGLLGATTGARPKEWLRDMLGTFRRAGQAKNSD